MRYQRSFFTLSGILGLLFLASRPAVAQRTSYSHITAVEGSASVISDANGRTEARVNLPLTTGDQVTTQAGARAEIELADGNRVQIAGESHIRLDALAGEDGSDAAESVVTLAEGSLAAESLASDDTHAFRIDTPDASVYMPQQAMARFNLDAGRGSSVIVRQGSVDVRSRTGSRTVEAGNYLIIRGEQEPEAARGSFSRDRFDIWVADRTNSILQAYNSTTSRYVEKDYSADASEMDQYGQWDYSPTYQSTIWRPSVAADWSPYTDGYWYSTPIGASWVSNEPWGWFPYHYGNWFFDGYFNSWCWSPAYVYSPAWVYWAYSPSFVGWCPIGYYSHYGPYCNYWGYGAIRKGLYVSVNGIFNPSRVDFRKGWSFVGVKNFGNQFSKASILAGNKLSGRLGSSLAITSDPMRVSTKGGSGAQAMRTSLTKAAQLVAQKSSPTKSAALAPYLARQKSLPQSTVAALKSSNIANVEPARRALTGPGVSGLPVAQKHASSPGGSPKLAGGHGSSGADWRSRDSSIPRISPAPGRPMDKPSSDWRSRPGATAGSGVKQQQPLAPRSGEKLPAPRPGAGSDWRSRGPSAGPPERRQQPLTPRNGQAVAPRRQEPSVESWRTRAPAPPAQRVIEGIDRGRAVPPPRQQRSFDQRISPRAESPSPERRYGTPSPRYAAPPERRFEPPAPRNSAPPERSFSSPAAPRFEAPRSSPAPRMESHPSPPQHSSPPSKGGSRGNERR